MSIKTCTHGILLRSIQEGTYLALTGCSGPMLALKPVGNHHILGLQLPDLWHDSDGVENSCLNPI